MESLSQFDFERLIYHEKNILYEITKYLSKENPNLKCIVVKLLYFFWICRAGK